MASFCDSRATRDGRAQRCRTPKKDDPPGGDVRAGLGNDAGWMRPRIEQVHECPKRLQAKRGAFA